MMDECVPPNPPIKTFDDAINVIREISRDWDKRTYDHHLTELHAMIVRWQLEPGWIRE